MVIIATTITRMRIMIRVVIYANIITIMNKIHETIKKQLIDAMRAKDAVQLDALRGLLAAFSNELIAKGNPNPLLDDESALTIIKRSVKQHKDSIEQFEKGGRADLAEKEKGELKFIEVFLPQMMSRDDIKKAIDAKLAGSPIDKTKAGQFVGMIMKELKGKADGSDVKAVVDEMLK
jgi:uncharacterized protein YqeY